MNISFYDVRVGSFYQTVSDIQRVFKKGAEFAAGYINVDLFLGLRLYEDMLPNLDCHATTVYDLLKMQGVPLGKADFLGKLRLGV